MSLCRAFVRHKIFDGAGAMSEKSVTELVGNICRPFGPEGESRVWLATRGPGEFVGKSQTNRAVSKLVHHATLSLAPSSFGIASARF